VAQKGYKSVPLFQKLGNAYYFNAQLEQAEKWYGELFALTDKLESEYYYRYAQSLRAVGNNEKANQILEKFNQIAKNDDRAELLLTNENYLQQIKANSGRYTIKDSG
jgi:tetratricopeptide (TPR) repeat protein